MKLQKQYPNDEQTKHQQGPSKNWHWHLQEERGPHRGGVRVKVKWSTRVPDGEVQFKCLNSRSLVTGDSFWRSMCPRGGGGG